MSDFLEFLREKLPDGDDTIYYFSLVLLFAIFILEVLNHV